MSARCWKSRQKEAVETKTQKKKKKKLYAELLTLKMQKLTMKEKNSKSPYRYPTVNVRLTQLYFVNCSNYFLSQSMQDVLRYCMSVAKANVTN